MSNNPHDLMFFMCIIIAQYQYKKRIGKTQRPALFLLFLQEQNMIQTGHPPRIYVTASSKPPLVLLSIKKISKHSMILFPPFHQHAWPLLIFAEL